MNHTNSRRDSATFRSAVGLIAALVALLVVSCSGSEEAEPGSQPPTTFADVAPATAPAGGDDPSSTPTAVPGTVASAPDSTDPSELDSAVSGLGVEEIAPGVTLDLRLVAFGGVDFDPNQDLEFSVVVTVEGLDRNVVVDLDTVHRDDETTSTIEATVLRRSDSFDDGRLVEVIPERDVFSTAALGPHRLTLNGAVEAADDTFTHSFARTVEFVATADGQAEVASMQFGDGTLELDLSRRWSRLEDGHSFTPRSESGFVDEVVGFDEDDTQVVADVGGRGVRLTVFRLTRPLLLPDPDVLVAELPAAVGPGDFDEPEAATIAGFDGVRLSGVVSGNDITYDLFRTGHEYLVVRTSHDDTPGARAEADSVIDSLTIDVDAFPRLTHRVPFSFWLNRGPNRYFQVDLFVPADWRPVETDGGARLVGPAGRPQVDLVNLPLDGRTMDELVDGLLATAEVTDPDDFDREASEVGGAERVDVSVTRVPVTARIVAFGDGDDAQVVIIGDPSPDPDVALLEAIADSVELEGPPAD